MTLPLVVKLAVFQFPLWRGSFNRRQLESKLDCLVRKSAMLIKSFYFFLLFINYEKLICTPGDDQMIALQVRGGPDSLMVSSWIQILKLRYSDAGTYHCVVTNKKGQRRASSTVVVNQVYPSYSISMYLFPTFMRFEWTITTRQVETFAEFYCPDEKFG